MTASDAQLPSGDTLHFWVLPPEGPELERLFQDGQALLSGEERARSRSMGSARRARRYLLGRILLRSALGNHLGCAPADLALSIGANGKPHLVSPQHAGLAFSLSHSREESVAAVAQAAGLGVDIEPLSRGATVLKIGQSYFSEPERRHLETLGEWGAEEALTLWTLKESATKALGRTVWEGLSGISLQRRGEALQWLDSPAEGRREDWMLLSGRFRNRHVLSAAIWRPGTERRQFTLECHVLNRAEEASEPFSLFARFPSA